MAGHEQNGQDFSTERDSGAGPEKQLCPLRNGHGTGQPGRCRGGAAEFSTLLANHPDYTAGYFMAAQTLANAGRIAEAIERLKAGVGCAARTGNSHALSEMQAMLDELDR